MKNENYKKSLTTTIKFFTFVFCIWKRIYFARKQSFGKWSFAITFLVKFFECFRIFETK